MSGSEDFKEPGTDRTDTTTRTVFWLSLLCPCSMANIGTKVSMCPIANMPGFKSEVANYDSNKNSNTDKDYQAPSADAPPAADMQ